MEKLTLALAQFCATATLAGDRHESARLIFGLSDARWSGLADVTSLRFPLERVLSILHGGEHA